MKIYQVHLLQGLETPEGLRVSADMDVIEMHTAESLYELIKNSITDEDTVKFSATVENIEEALAAGKTCVMDIFNENGERKMVMVPEPTKLAVHNLSTGETHNLQ